MKNTFLKLFLIILILASNSFRSNATTTSEKENAYGIMINRVLTLVELSGKNTIAFVTTDNKKEENRTIQEFLRENNYTVNVYSLNEVKSITESIILLSSDIMMSSLKISKENKINFSPNIDDLKNSSASFSIKEIGGLHRIYISEGFFKNNNIKLDKRLIRVAIIISSK
ncbi:MAG: hypothetical protein GW817_12685 [Flavobacteriales bacterium]|nr:hypothetical protein [Flavobacteriales bacterium]NCT14420.1 hypothetical protein [Flavobacteriales bacterium]